MGLHVINIICNVCKEHVWNSDWVFFSVSADFAKNEPHLNLLINWATVKREADKSESGFIV